MTSFLISAALLVIAALTAVLVPLLKKNPGTDGSESSALSLQILREHLEELEHERQADTLSPAQYEKERAEIERRAIEDGRLATPSAVAPTDRRPVWLAAAISAAVAVLTVALYLQLGTPTALQSVSNQGGQQQNAHAVTPQQIQAMVIKLAERLQDNPADGEGWLMLARSYSTLGRFAEASAAFGRATSLLPPDAQLLSDYADTLAMAQGRSLVGDPEKIIKRALEADPRNIKALALSGSAAFERRDYVGAIGEWRKVLAVVPGDSSVAERIRTSIADAEMKSGKGSDRIGVATMPASASINGTVSLDSALRDQVVGTDTVFIFARAIAGSRMPLAIKRMTAGELPARFTLDDSMSMPGGPKLSEHKQVVIGARISRSGNATPGPGDLEGYVDSVTINAENVRLTISRVIPRQ